MEFNVDYDTCYAALQLPPGSPMPAIRKARNRLAKMLHRDLNPTLSDEPLKAVLSAFDSLEKYWNEHGHPPPTGPAPEDNPWPRARPGEDARTAPPPPPPELALVIARIEKSLPHDLIDFIETLSWGWIALSCFAGFTLLLACGLAGQALVAAGVIDQTVRPGIVAVLWGVGFYLVWYGPYGYYCLYKIDLERQERWTKVSADRFAAIISETLVAYPAIAAQWDIATPVTVPEDGSQLIIAKLAFEHRLLGVFLSRFEVSLFLKFKAARTGTRYAWWFERRSTGMWWPPVLGMSRMVAGRLRRMV